MENQQDLTNQSQTQLSLEKRISDLEKRLDEALMIIADTYRYGRLRDLLAAEKWREADLETTKVMIEITGKAELDQITPDDIQRFPCNDIMVIDQLWKKYSSNHFGFSLQLRIYQSVGGSIDTIRAQKIEFLQRTGEKTGWRKDGKKVEVDDFKFSLEAPEGALPGSWWMSPYGAKMANFFLARLLTCEI